MCHLNRQIPALQISVSARGRPSELLGLILLINASAADTIGTLQFIESQVLFHNWSAMHLFLKHRILLNGLELGLEVAKGVSMRAAIRATTGIGELEIVVVLLFARTAPQEIISGVN